jgi:ligand-binding sensor domain-containing protein/DNA-binding CsgD family transcriptional regulator
MTRIFLTAILALVFLALAAQAPVGLPEIVNYNKQMYRGGAQTRQIAQDKNGVLYFANNEGLLTFDGARWKTYPLPNKSLVRCLRFGDDNRLYVGGQDEFGFFSPSTAGVLQYQSLKDILPQQARSFADVWEICLVGKAVFFQTSDRIYRIEEKKVTVFEDQHWRFMGMAGNELIAQSHQKGLLRFGQNEWAPYAKSAKNVLPADWYATSITTIGKDSNLLTSLKDGIFLLTNGEVENWKTPAIPGLPATNISSSFLVNESQVAIGTSLDGCFIFDKNGRLVQHFSRNQGLQDNSILTIFLDREKNLWFGLRNGIDFVAYNNAVKYITPAALKEGAGYSSQLYQGALYFGTSVGLFKIPVSGQKDLSSLTAPATLIRNSTGEAWNLSEVNGQLLMGHHEGAFLVWGNGAISLDKSNGYWNFQPLAGGSSSPVVAGTYKGLSFYNYQQGHLEKLPGETLAESARFVVAAAGRVWFSHPYKGIYAVVPKDGASTVKKYGVKEGVASANNNYLFWIRKALVLTTEKGIFEYNREKDSFEPSAFYNKLLPKFPIRYLKEDKQGNIWFVFEKKIGVLDLSEKKPQIIYIPELNNRFVAGFEHVNPVDENNILIGGEKGFYHLNYRQYKSLRYPLTTLISSVSVINQNDSVLFGGYSTSAVLDGTAGREETRLHHNYNSLRFEFASAVYGQLTNIEYSYLLEGFDEGWSDFNKKTEKEYTNLPPGNYIFKVKARNNLGNESGISEYRFSILPPWYRTTVAYFLYLLLLAECAYLIYRYQKAKLLKQQRRHEEEQRRLQYLHQLELEKAEKELVELRNAKLEAELRNKDTELASTAMHLIQKSDVLLKIKGQMTKLKEAPDALENTVDLKKILKTLNDENKVDEQWQQFSQHFDTVHQNFLAKLKKRHPDLTPNEQKLCAYLKMNMSTKEIAQLMNISVRGVEISRYRLRKKLGIPTGTHLFNFLDAVE